MDARLRFCVAACRGCDFAANTADRADTSFVGLAPPPTLNGLAANAAPTDADALEAVLAAVARRAASLAAMARRLGSVTTGAEECWRASSRGLPPPRRLCMVLGALVAAEARERRARPAAGAAVPAGAPRLRVWLAAGGGGAVAAFVLTTVTALALERDDAEDAPGLMTFSLVRRRGWAVVDARRRGSTCGAAP